MQRKNLIPPPEIKVGLGKRERWSLAQAESMFRSNGAASAPPAQPKRAATKSK
jgi:hypothetical protein